MKLFICLALTLILSAQAFAEQKEGGGGSGVAAEFIEAAHSLIERLSAKPLAEVNLEAFKTAVAETRVVTKKSLVLRGDAVDAINYPKRKRIEVSVSRWNKLSSTPWVKLQLTFHEYLGILGIDDSDYQLSRQILNSDLCERTPAVKLAIERSLLRACDEVTLKDLSYVRTLIISELETFRPTDFKDMMYLGRLQIISTLPKVNITKEFMKLIPTIHSIDIEAGEIVIEPGAFENSSLGYLQLSNVQLSKGSFKGLKANLVLFTKIPKKSGLEALEAALATEYSCAANEYLEEGYSNLVCQKN